MALLSQASPPGADVRGDVRDYYGKRVKTSEDLMTSCCTMDPETFSTEAREARKLIHPEVLSKYGIGAGKLHFTQSSMDMNELLNCVTYLPTYQKDKILKKSKMR